MKTYYQEHERVFVHNFVDWYNRKNGTRVRLLGPAREVLGETALWAWACRDASTGRELAIEVKRLEMPDRGEIEGPILRFFRHEVGQEVAGKIQGRYHLMVRHPGPPEWSAAERAALKRRIAARVTRLAAQMSQAPESERRWRDGDLELTLIKLGPDENEWRCSFQFSPGYIWTQFIMDHTVRSGLATRNHNLRPARERGIETILLCIRSFVPTYGADLGKSFGSVDPKEYRYIDHAYSIGWDNEVRELPLAPLAEQPKEERFKVIITNDDGIYARGLWALAEALQPVCDVVIVAPDREQSGVGTAVTLHSPVRVNSVLPLVKGVEAYSVEGTPADCVIIGLGSLVKNGPVGMVFSGINEGANLGNDVLISGTVGGAFQGCFRGLPAVAMSLSTRGDVYHFETAQKLAVLMVEAAKRGDLPTGLVLNVNVPNAPHELLDGVDVTRLALRSYQDLVEERDHGRGRIYHWIMRGIPDWTEEQGTDVYSLRRRRVSITPLHSGMTAARALKSLDGWDERLFRELKGERELAALPIGGRSD